MKDGAPRPRTALLLGAEENPALPILESLAAAGIQVDVASHRRICVGFFSRFARRRWLYPDPVHEARWVERILQLVGHGRYDVTLAAGEEPTHLLSRHRERFLEHTRIPLVPYSLFMTCRDKSLTMRAAARLGVPTPRTFDPEVDAVASIAARVDFPVVVKPNVSDGARGISFPASPAELERTLESTRRRYGPCHVQEYIPQTGRQYKAELLLDRAGDVKAWCVYAKLRYYPPTGGSSTLAQTVDRPDILETAARMVRGLGWHGMADCDFIEDPRDGVPKLMEINPRFTRSIKICVRAGVDFPAMLYRLALGETFEPVLQYRVGTTLRYLPADILWFLRSSQRFQARPSFFSVGRDSSEEIFSWRDPGPTLAYVLSGITDLFDRRARAFRLRTTS